MGIRTWKVAPLLFGSGLCALIYQIAWLREFRLVFGASTAASAAVVAIFIGGLGLGGWLLGKRVDRHERPLEFYANLEMGIAMAAAVTPGLLWLVRTIYVALGGSVSLGMGFATVFRLVFASLVLLVPTFLMGGTLPAAARAVETDEDKGRRRVGLLYGVNTLGAVTGALLANFLLLEVMGNHKTLWIACLLNLLVAILARRIARKAAARTETSQPQDQPALEPAPAPMTASAPPWFVLMAAAVVGFAFFLMELVWYRMLGPLLGGTVFTFGLILAVALLGIGLGGAAYAAVGRRRPATLLGFATTCLLEAVCIAFPFALGDEIATFALLLQPVGHMGFLGHVFGWSLVTGLVVLPAAIVAGYQFPMLIGLLGQGRDKVGREVGLTYAWNTVGAILGSLAGGFGLLPLLTAPGCWQLTAYLLVALGLAALVLVVLRRGFVLKLVAPASLTLVVVLMLCATGPTAAWRHAPIGAGRVDTREFATPNKTRNWERHARRIIIWEEEGVESSVALQASNGLAFVLNGKSDGNAKADAATMVMSGLLGAFLHPDVKRAMVIGLGTGGTAGWLGALPGIERVDCVELESAILEVARRCVPVNRDVMDNPRVHMIIGDGREVLLTTSDRYDLIVSEPSNPFRAGIASLFTREFYESVADRLAPGGIFVQWLQSYEVDAQTVRTVYATLAAVFPEVNTWDTGLGDLLLVASMEPVEYDASMLRARLETEPFREGIAAVWRVTDLEGVFAHHLATASLARAVAEREGDWLNTDDHNKVEFGFARTLGSQTGFSNADLLATAIQRNESRPEVLGGQVDWAWVDEMRHAIFVVKGDPERLARNPYGDEAARHRLAAAALYQAGRYRESLEQWRAQEREPRTLTELAFVADTLAEAGDEAALDLIEKLRSFQPTEAEIILARLHLAQGRPEEATTALERAFVMLRSDPWPLTLLVTRALEMSRALARDNPGIARRIIRALRKPFSVYVLNDQRLVTILDLGGRFESERLCIEVFLLFEPNFPWHLEALGRRRACYKRADHELAERATEELREFLAHQPVAFDAGLVEP